MSKRTANRGGPHEVVVVLSVDEVRTLGQLAHYYQRSMGPMRYIVRLTAAAEVRAKYRFIAEESNWLQKFIESAPLEAANRDGLIEVEFASRTVIAYWGRLLSSLHSKRARRRLKPDDIAIREALGEKLCDAARRLEARWPGSLECDFATRRPDEASWMREELGGKRAGAPSDQSRHAPSG